MQFHQQQLTKQQQTAQYVVLGSRGEICKEVKMHRVLQEAAYHLVYHIKQYQDPTKSPDEWRKLVMRSKYDSCAGDTLNTSSNAPSYFLVFGQQSFLTLVRTFNPYVTSIHPSIDLYNKKFDMALPPRKLAINMERLFHENGLVVNHPIPLQLSDIEKNKQLKNP